MKNPLPAGVSEEALNEDARLARERDLKFDVTTKAGRGLRWEYVATDIEDLAEALALACGVSAYESGVFARYAKWGRFLYWTSLQPDLLNSTVLSIMFDDSE